MILPESTSVEDLSQAFKALGHPQRLRIVRNLLARTLACCDQERPEDCSLDPASCNVGEVAAGLEVSAATVSHHLKELDRAGIIERVRDGRYLYCRIHEDRLRQLIDFLEASRPAWREGARDTTESPPSESRAENGAH